MFDFQILNVNHRVEQETFRINKLTPTLRPISSTPAGAWSTQPWGGPSFWSVGSGTSVTER